MKNLSPKLLVLLFLLAGLILIDQFDLGTNLYAAISKNIKKPVKKKIVKPNKLKNPLSNSRQPLVQPSIVPYTPPSKNDPGYQDMLKVQHSQQQNGSGSSWFDNGTDWMAVGTPPACPKPLALQPPVDFNFATSLLYPGQYRGNQYKPHGGFRFDNNTNNNISVKIPLDAELVNGSRYIQSGEVQYLLTFISPCGLMYRFDHLLTLTPKFRALAESLPPPPQDDSRTTNFNPPISVKAGEEVATAVGFTLTKNVAVDFGVYDLRKLNPISQNANWANEHRSDPGYRLAAHGVCWLNFFGTPNEQLLRNLPGGDSVNGKTSDYCQSH